MRFIVWTSCAASLIAGGPARADDPPRFQEPASVTEAPLTRPPARLCADDPGTPPRAEIRNTDKRTLGEMLGITRYAVVTRYSSGDWSGSEDVPRRIREILEARPRVLSPFVNWSEGADFARHAFVVTLRTLDGGTARIDVGGYQVCVRDARGAHWYFRDVPLDVWPGSEADSPSDPED
jgi:hypothetical protein